MIIGFFQNIILGESNIFKKLPYFLVIIIICTFGFMFSFAIGKKSVRYLGKYSEKIFEKLNFENVKNQDFYNKPLFDSEGVYASVMKYRKNLKGKDPYPEDYFDKKRDE